MYNVVLIMGTRISSFVPSNLYLPTVEAERLKATESVRAILRGEQIFPKKKFFVLLVVVVFCVLNASVVRLFQNFCCLSDSTWSQVKK